MRTREPYATDLSDEQWEQLNALLPRKRTPETRAREYINAILYGLRTGCSWALLPHDFPKFETVKSYFSKLRRDGTWQRIHDTLREQARQASGREGEPSLLILDSQSVKTTEKGGRAATMGAKR